jgi:hypothetical protein
MASKRELTQQYGRDEGDTFVMVCPTCEPEEIFPSIEQWKEHMQKQHGGYTSSEVSSGLGEPQKGEEGSADTGKVSGKAPPPKPKRLSQRARELNDKVNRCVSLVIKHIISGITEEERQQMESLRTDVTEAFVGIEFDFEERLFSLQGKWAVLVVLVLLYTLPSIPSMKEAIAKAKEKAKEKLK